MKTSKSAVPEIRTRDVNGGAINADGDYVLYWMIAFRRTHSNFALQHAINIAKELDKPLLVLEPLRAAYHWNCDRFHAFIIQGMADNAARFQKAGVTYYPYLEPQPDDGQGLLQKLADEACAIVTDDFPCFFLPRMINAAGRQVSVRLEAIDSNGLYPMRDTDRVFKRAVDFRRHLQKTLRPFLEQFPIPDPLKKLKLATLDEVPPGILKKWPAADPETMVDDLTNELAKFPINHEVTISEIHGGAVAGKKQLREFVKSRLEHYEDARNEPERQMSSGLSPWLHFGHLSAHEAFTHIVDDAGWSIDDLAEKATAKNRGWWGASVAVESFLDELITWREIGFNRCALTDDFTDYESLPEWAQKTLGDHADDPREYLYTLEEFEHSQTHDPLWNAAQRQLFTTGVIHNYLRMLWGKKILEWTKSPQDALDVMIELNNKYALDGRDPNSYSGIFWVLGRYDRAWGERPVFGKTRYMSSENTARKIKTKSYIKMYS